MAQFRVPFCLRYDRTDGETRIRAFDSVCTRCIERGGLITKIAYYNFNFESVNGRTLMLTIKVHRLYHRGRKKILTKLFRVIQNRSLSDFQAYPVSIAFLDFFFYRHRKHLNVYHDFCLQTRKSTYNLRL